MTDDIPSSSFNPCGPIEIPGMKTLVDAEGVQAPGYVFKNRCRKPSPWNAKWLWLADGSSEKAFFRKEIRLETVPAKAPAWVTADMKYRLWVNGRLASRGPADIGKDYEGGSTGRWLYDAIDIAHLLKNGKNLVAAEVWGKWPISHVATQGRPGFLFEADLEVSALSSDSSWRASGEEPPYGWQELHFDASDWTPAKEIENVWPPLTASEIPPLMEAAYPAKAVEGLGKDGVLPNGSSFKAVFDQVLSGFPRLSVEGARGATLKIKAQHEASFKLAGGRQEIEFPFMTEIAPSFSATLEGSEEPLKVLDVSATFTSQPLEYRGSFECDDAFFNRLWKVSRWTVQICLQTHHLDSPNHQEPISDPGDYVIEAMVNSYAFAQHWLTRQDLRKFAWLLKDKSYRSFHISYSIAWLEMLMDYYDFTGDKALVDELAPYAHELLDAYESWRGRNGLVSEAPNYMFMDWVEIGGFNCHHPPAVIGQGYLTAFYAHGLAMGLRLAGLAGDDALAEKYRLRRKEVSEAFNRELWNESRGLYRDGKPFQTSVKPHRWLPADVEIETFSPHVNLLSVLFGLAPENRLREIVEGVMREKPLNVQPWFTHWVFRAFDKAGLFERFAPEPLRRWRVIEETQSFREMWDGGDLSHGWCSTPLVQMSSRILGVTPKEPGFKKAAIRPALCGLKQAKGKVPTPQGDVAVSWRREGASVAFEISLPEGVEAEFTPPAFDGKSREPFALGAGESRFSIP